MVKHMFKVRRHEYGRCSTKVITGADDKESIKLNRFAPTNLCIQQDHFTILEVLEVFKNSKPFPVSYQKGWKLNSFANGHRVWFQFLTIARTTTFTTVSPPLSTSAAVQPSSLSCIKVFAAYDLVHSSPQFLLQVVKDTSLSCEWKPGVIAARSVHEVPASEVVGDRSADSPSLPVLNDFVRVESVQPCRRRCFWHGAGNAIPTIIEDYKRYWHKEENGCRWLLQINEKSQSIVFFLIQPVADTDWSLLTVVSWSSLHTDLGMRPEEAAPVLLSSLSEFIRLRRVQMTPLMHISRPLPVPSDSDASAGGSDLLSSRHCAAKAGRCLSSVGSTEAGFVASVTQKPGKEESTSRMAGRLARTVIGVWSKRPDSGVAASHTESSILRCRRVSATVCASGRGACVHSDVVRQTVNGTTGDNDSDSPRFSYCEENGMSCGTVKMMAYVSDGSGNESSDAGHVNRFPIENDLAYYRNIVKKASDELLHEVFLASSVNIQTPNSDQAEPSNQWIYQGYENNVMVMKKVPLPHSTLQCYMGKGLILAPPSVVWDCIRHPQTRFIYDDTIKKVDTIERVSADMSIVYTYNEVQSPLHRECYDAVLLQGEQCSESKFVLTCVGVDHASAPVSTEATRTKVMPSGWIVEPVSSISRLDSMVTYLVQADHGLSCSDPDRLRFQEVLSRQPLSINLLQEYLKPALHVSHAGCLPSLDTQCL